MINFDVDFDAGIKNRGNIYRLKKVFDRAKNGESLNIAFLGGSITQGSLSSTEQTCYAYRVFDWWTKEFPNAKLNYINAGIGGTTSQFGVARVEEDVLSQNPDFVIIEFSVNDDATEHFMETYEGLIRKVYTSKTEPAVVCVHNVCYDSGASAEMVHGRIVRHYNLPSVSMRSSVFVNMLNGGILNRDITPDDLHPNDKGHELLAGLIINYLKKVSNGELGEAETVEDVYPNPLTANGYEKSIRYRNINSNPVLKGFIPDTKKQEHVRDTFHYGWTSGKEGDSVTFNVKGSEIAVQYRKSVKLPAPIAKIIVDDDEANAKLLDANFDETWGDCLALDTIVEHGENKEHKVEIRIVETHENDAVPFYLVSLIVSEGADLTNQPIFLEPVCTHNIWGGTRLRTDYEYPVWGDDIGECWGISAHPNGDGTVRAGEYAGKKLSELWENNKELFGNVDLDRFPLLTKIIDAKDDLSIQVHPEDEYAKLHENGSLGKTECWYILDCPEDATLVIGHNATTHEELEQMIHEGRWAEFIRAIPVKKGDFLQINPGTVHAIKGGVLILETQQNSDITYRVYDYDRLQDGKPRQLHVEQSIDVITVPAASIDDSVIDASNLPVNTLNELYACKYYHVYKLNVEGESKICVDAPFMLMSVVEGCGRMGIYSLKKGDHFILPSGMMKQDLVFEGNMEIVASTI